MENYYQKKHYKKPILSIHGDVKEITKRAEQGSVSDARGGKRTN